MVRVQGLEPCPSAWKADMQTSNTSLAYLEPREGIEPTSLHYKSNIIAVILTRHRLLMWYGARDLNPKPPGSKPGALSS